MQLYIICILLFIIQNRFVKLSDKSQTMKNNRHFQQNFQDSEMQGSGIYNNFDQGGSGRPIQLIKIKPYGKIQVDQTALDIISNCDMPVGFCCIAGKYRTGKSFLLNKLLKLQGNGFRVDPSTVACTQGIWMWSKPLINQRQGNYIFFLDTQGSASLNRDSNNDAKVFTLANLISSYLVFNSVGAIDEKSISQLNLVTQLSKNIILQQYSDLKNNEQNLYRYMPKFLWLIRDFTLELTDRNGKRVKAPQYLQDVLFQQNTAVKADESTKKIRRALTKYYKDRDCLTLVRPAYEQKDLQNLNSLPEHALRRDFIQGVNILRDKILKNTGPKTYQQNPLFGTAISSMLQSYVNMMNNGGIPSIHTAWQQINEDQGVYAYEEALKRFNELYAQNFQQQKPKGQQIHTILRVINQASIDQFHKHISQPNDAYQGKLREFISQKQQAILQINKQMVEMRNIQILKQCMSPVIQKIQSNQYDNNPDQVNVDLREASKRFNERAKGENKGQILAQFITTMNPIILGIGNKNKNQGSQQQQIERLKREHQQVLASMQKQMQSLRNQNESSKNAKTVAKVTTTDKKGTVTTKEITKKQSKGCCGGTSKCLIM